MGRGGSFRYWYWHSVAYGFVEGFGVIDMNSTPNALGRIVSDLELIGYLGDDVGSFPPGS